MIGRYFNFILTNEEGKKVASIEIDKIKNQAWVYDFQEGKVVASKFFCGCHRVAPIIDALEYFAGKFTKDINEASEVAMQLYSDYESQVVDKTFYLTIQDGEIYVDGRPINPVLTIGGREEER